VVLFVVEAVVLLDVVTVVDVGEALD
jgi:hypothetical protein